MLRGVQQGILLQQCVYGGGGFLQHPRIIVDIPDAESEIAALADTEEIPRSPQFQILIGNKKAVVGLVQDLQPFHGFLILLCADENTVTLVLPPAHTAPQLVKLGQPETLRVLQDRKSVV